MIRKLRIKFVAAAMLSVFIVLLLILGTVNILNYRQVVQNADDILSVLAQNNGAFPKSREEPMPGRRPGGRLMSPEIPFESRYFSVLLDEQGGVIITQTGMIAAIDARTARSYALQVFQSVKKQGFIGDYRYIRQVQGKDTQIIFLDCGRNLSTFRDFLIISILVACLGLLAVLLLVVILSRRIVRPFAESYTKQKRFITDAGHEIKTPLTIIDADAAVLEMELGEDNEWLQDIQKQTRRLKELTNDLIYLSRMEESQEEIQKIDFPFSDVVAETAQSFQSLALTRNKSFDCQIEPLVTYRGDEEKIRKLLSILLDNALKYSQEGGRISLDLKRVGKNISLSVYNTTQELTPEALPHLFDRFYRADQSRNSQAGGYGIGLSIAWAIVTAHKGKITASSQDGKSLLVTVVLGG